MAGSIKVPKMMLIAGVAVSFVAVHSTALYAQADTGRFVTEQQMLSVDKKKKQDAKAAPVPRSKSTSDYGRIGANPRKGVEVPPQCEDAYAMAAQIMAGGPTDRMVTSRNLGNMDASQGLPTPPMQTRMEPREPGFTSSARHGRSEINKSLNSMRRSNDPARRMTGC